MPSPTSESQPSDKASATRMGASGTASSNMPITEPISMQMSTTTRSMTYLRAAYLRITAESMHCRIPLSLSTRNVPPISSRKTIIMIAVTPSSPASTSNGAVNHRQTGRRGASGVSA